METNRTLNIYCILTDSACCGLEYLITNECITKPESRVILLGWRIGGRKKSINAVYSKDFKAFFFFKNYNMIEFS